MGEITEEDILAEAPVVAERIVAWFRERLRIADAQRVVANEQRVTAEQQRVVAEHDRTTAEQQQAGAEQRVVDVEELLAAADELSRHLQQALDSRIVIEQAKGLLAGRYGVTPDVAFEALRRHARSNRQSLRDVAAEVMSGETSLEV